MIYFSELNNLRVYNLHNHLLGRLIDLVFLCSETPYITKLVVKEKNKLRFLPLDQVVRFDKNRIIVKKMNGYTKTGINELFLRKNLLDTQVIDISGNRVVRVNDVLFQKANLRGLIIYGIDISISGILRWFKLEKPIEAAWRFFGKSLPENILAWSDIQPLELVRGHVVLNCSFNKLQKLHPADLADYLETQNIKNVLNILKGLDKQFAAQVISELNPNFQLHVLKSLSSEQITYIISFIDPDDAVDILLFFEPKIRDEILAKIDAKEAATLKRLLSLSGTNLGDYLTSDFYVVGSEQSAGRIIKRIKKETKDLSWLSYIYVVNEKQQLVGVFNLHELVMADSDTPVYRFMAQKLVVAHLHTPLEVAFRRMIKYKLSALPVTDENKKILGIVTADDIGEKILEKL